MEPVLPALSPDQVSIVAAVHVQGDSARIVIAELSGPSGPILTQTHTADARNIEAIAELVTSAAADVVLRIIPGSATIARTLTLPDLPGATDAELLSALELIAESELPPTLTHFRRVAGLLPGTGAVGRGTLGGRSTPIALGWTGTPPSPDDVPRIWGCPVVWTAELVGLAALSKAMGGGHTAAYMDTAASSASILALGAEKTIARVMRLASEMPVVAAERAIRETASAAGAPALPDIRIEGPFSVFVHPHAASITLAGRAMDLRAINDYGIALGAIFAFADPNPVVRSLVGLHEHEPRGRASLPERAVRYFGVPMRAIAVFAICLLALLAVPFGVAYAKYNGLKKAVAGDPGLSERIVNGERQVAFYKLLRDRRWPMTKLLSDISSSAPVGITLDAVDIAQGDGVTLRGVAETSDQVTTFRENLLKTKIFNQVSTPSISSGMPTFGILDGVEPDTAVVQFQLTAKVPVNAAVFAAKPIDDFAEKSLAERMYGPGAAISHRSSRSARPSRSTSDTTRTDRSTRRDTAAPTRSASSDSVKPASTAKAPEVPAPLTDDQINKLDRTKAMLEWAKRKAAAAQSGVEESVKKRLQDESEKAKKRMDALKDAPAGGAK